MQLQIQNEPKTYVSDMIIYTTFVFREDYIRNMVRRSGSNVKPVL
jgi:hypothetical protein